MTSIMFAESSLPDEEKRSYLPAAGKKGQRRWEQWTAEEILYFVSAFLPFAVDIEKIAVRSVTTCWEEKTHFQNYRRDNPEYSQSKTTKRVEKFW